MFHQLSKTKYFQIGIILLIEVLSFGATNFFSTIDCSDNIDHEISSHDAWSPLQKECTSPFSCSNIYLNPEQLFYPHDDILYQGEFFESGCDAKEDPECELKFKVTAVEKLPLNDQGARIPCPITPNPEDRVLLAHPDNCSLFYKCDWSTAVLFECPEELHFNNDLQICDWPWQAGCDKTWTRCPRPRPLCPAQHSLPVYLSHPYLCDQFYQCSWGQAYLQSCPTGLHFNPKLKVCDWPHNAKCHIC